MRSPQTPVDEEQRLVGLQALNILYTPAEERFDRITRCAAKLLDAPISLVSLVAADVQWFKSAQGLDAVSTPRSVSFCGHAILSDKPLVVNDAKLDSRFHDNPLVTGEPFIRAYAGQPLHSPEGKRVGSLCVIDRRPRSFTEGDLEVLRDLATWVETELRTQALSASQQDLASEVESLRRTALVDRLTHTWNRGAIDDVLTRELARGRRDETPVGLAMIDIDHFKQINDTYGHPGGDEVLREIARRIRAAIRPSDALGRYGGEEFLMVLANCDDEEAIRAAERVREAIRERPVTLASGAEVQVTASLGVMSALPQHATSDPTEWIECSDQALYRAKRDGRDRAEFARRDRRAA
ncbi:MAG: sensor domain-containing diguanylate cyclase [Thermoanaerobaculia bacterium]